MGRRFSFGFPLLKPPDEGPYLKTRHPQMIGFTLVFLPNDPQTKPQLPCGSRWLRLDIAGFEIRWGESLSQRIQHSRPLRS